MVYLLLAVLTMLFLSIYILNGRDLLAPSVLVTILFIISTLFVIPVIDIWNVQIDSLTILIIAAGICSFSFGELLSKGTKIKMKTSFNNYFYEPIILGKLTMILIIVFMLITTYFYYQQVLMYARAAGYNNESTMSMLYYARTATITTSISQTVSTNKVLGQCVSISYSLAHLFLYIVIYNIIFLKNKKRIVFYVTVIAIYMVQTILSAGRTGFINFIGAFIIMYAILSQMKYGWNKNYNRFIKPALKVFILMIVVFYLLGNFTGKTLKLNFVETISIYIGSPIVAFDNFLKNFNGVSTQCFGENTFIGIYDVLARLGCNVHNVNAMAEFVSLGNYQTNIYTSFMRYIKDFSYCGYLLIEVFLGMFYGIFYHEIKSMNYPSLKLIIYAVVMQVVFQISIEERFFMNIISLGYITRMIYIVIFYKIIINKKDNRKPIDKIFDETNNKRGVF